MTILKQGTLPTETETEYYGKCDVCGTIFKATEDETIPYHNGYHVTRCPYCEAPMQIVYTLANSQEMLKANGICIGTDATTTFTGNPIIPNGLEHTIAVVAEIAERMDKAEAQKKSPPEYIIGNYYLVQFKDYGATDLAVYMVDGRFETMSCNYDIESLTEIKPANIINGVLQQ